MPLGSAFVKLAFSCAIWIGLVSAAWGQANEIRLSPGSAGRKGAPAQADQERFLAAARRTALEYARSLPEFLCSETVKRSVEGQLHYRQLDTLVFEISFHEQKESQKLIAVNGRTFEPGTVGVIGTASTGDFGANFTRVFDPSSQTEFRFERWARERGKEAAVYSYRIARANHPYELKFAAGDTGAVSEYVGLRGEITLDPESMAVWRIQYIADEVPAKFPIRRSSLAVDYDYAEIGGRHFFLPAKATHDVYTSQRHDRNEIVFGSYRKFEIDSSVRYAK